MFCHVSNPMASMSVAKHQESQQVAQAGDDEDDVDAPSSLTSSDYVPKAVEIVHSDGNKKRMVGCVPAI